MKKLKDLCLDFVAVNLNGIISKISWGVANTHKEDLLERVVNHNRLTIDYLPHVTYNLFAPTLKRVVLFRSHQVTDEVLRILGTSGCQLKELIMVECSAVTDAGIVYITKNQTSLQLCQFKHMQLTSKGLAALKSPALETLDFTGSGVDNSAVKLVLKNNKSVRHLVLSRCKNIDNSLMACIGQQLGASLETFELCGTHCLLDAGLQQLAEHCPNLTRLNLHGCNKITIEGLNMVNSMCQKLQQLDLSFCTGLSDVQTTSFNLSSLPLSLRELSLVGLMLKDTELLVSAIVRLTSLRCIRFCGILSLTDEAIEQMLSAIGAKLETLDLNGGLMSALTESSVTSIVRHCPRLVNIGLSLNKNMTATALIPLLEDRARAERVTHLQLNLKELDVNVLYHISKNCRNLEELELSGVSDVSDEFLVSVADSCASSLQFVGLKGCRQVTDVGVIALAKCGKLTCAVLSGNNKLTDRSVIALANGCPYLQEIYLSGCNLVTRAAIRYLVETCVPRVFWEHRVPNVDPEQMLVYNLDDGGYSRVE